MNPAMLQMNGVVKQFPGVRALDGVDFHVMPGEVHCLLGQNGAGKSTLIKVLAGAHRPDEGEILWQGRPVTLRSPQDAIDVGISTIYQELDLVPGLSIAENVFLGHEPSRLGLTRPQHVRDAARRILTQLGHGDMPVDREVGGLPAASQQIVSIARAISREARLIVMDEPSAVLDGGEVATLFGVVRQLTAQGVSVVYISHRLAEIREIGGRVTVLKDGRTVANDLPAATTPTATLIELMTGRSVDRAFPAVTGPPAGAPALLEVEGLGRPGEFHDVSFTVRAGEVVGLAGLVGSGRTEILETVYGARRAGSGTVRVAGRRLRNGSVGSAVAAGVGLAPEERKSQGLLLDESIARNISVATLSRFARAGFVLPRTEREAAERLAASVDLRPPAVDRAVRTLSGGNQQKVVLARWLLRDCRVLLLDEPTRGVDVGARSEIYALVRDLAGRGVAVVVVSSEVEEVLGLSDRVLVLRDGRVVHQGPAADIDESAVLGLVIAGGAADTTEEAAA